MPYTLRCKLFTGRLPDIPDTSKVRYLVGGDDQEEFLTDHAESIRTALPQLRKFGDPKFNPLDAKRPRQRPSTTVESPIWDRSPWPAAARPPGIEHPLVSKYWRHLK